MAVRFLFFNSIQKSLLKLSCLATSQIKETCYSQSSLVHFRVVIIHYQDCVHINFYCNSQSLISFNKSLCYSQTSGVPSTLAVLNEVPQPHEAMAFGLSMVKPPPIKDCL